jgi:hypothetical protein
MAMPKTAMHEDGPLEARENEIWRSWEIAPVQPKPKPKGECKPSDNEFRLCVFAPNARHQH